MIKQSVFFGIYIIIAALLLGAIFAGMVDRYYLFYVLVIIFLPILVSTLYELYHGILGSEFFVTIASVIGFLSGETDSVLAILMIMLIAKFFEQLVEEKTDNAIQSLLKVIPHEATIQLDDNHYETVEIKNIVPPMVLVVKSGGQIPVDGKIIYGFAAINESSINGESLPREKSIGDQVFAGSFIESGMIKIIAEKVGSDTFFAKMKESIELSQKNKAKISLYTANIASILVPLMLVFICLIWLVTGNSTLIVTLLVFGSPLELTVITPLALLAGVIAAFRQGILVKGGVTFEKLAAVNVFAFDKTGTLTEGNLEIAEIVSFTSKYTTHDILKLAAIAEKNSEHLIAKAVLNRAQVEGIEIPQADTFEPMVGFGIKITYLGDDYFLGSQKYADFLGIKVINQENLECTSPGFHTTFFIFKGEQLIGRICVLDKIRNNTKIILQGLGSYGIQRLCLLSGDNKKVVQAVGQQLGFQDYCGDLLPTQKADLIKKLQIEGFSVAMVGDGINDAPALRQADVGIVFGGMGVEPAIEAGKVILMSNDLHKILFVIGLSKKIMSVIKQNIIFGFVLIHVSGMALAFYGILNPLQAALFHAFSDFIVLINSFRIISFKGQRE